MQEINKRHDKYAKKSADILKKKIRYSITSVFKTTLDMVELKFGKNFDGYEDLRAKILRTGNDAIRELEESINSKYNIEMLSNILTVVFREQEKERK